MFLRCFGVGLRYSAVEESLQNRIHEFDDSRFCADGNNDNKNDNTFH